MGQTLGEKFTSGGSQLESNAIEVVASYTNFIHSLDYFELFNVVIFFFSETLGLVRDFMDVFAHVSMCASCFMIVALTCERHFAIDSPHQVSQEIMGLTHF